jgi:hypothetical protein
MKTKIATFITIPLVFIMAYLLIQSVKGDIDMQSRVKIQQEQVIKKLKLIRDLQQAYVNLYGKYADTWDKLEDFVNNGKIPKIERIQKKTEEEGKYKIVLDTIGKVSVKEAIISKYEPSLLKDGLATVPNMPKGKNFLLKTGKVNIAKSGSEPVYVQVVLVKDLYPIDVERGAFFDDKGQPLNVNDLIAEFSSRQKTLEEKAKPLREKMNKTINDIRKSLSDKDLAGVMKGKKESDLEPTKDSIALAKAEKMESYQKDRNQLSELSKLINLNKNRIEKLTTKPLQFGSLSEAVITGNWE